LFSIEGPLEIERDVGDALAPHRNPGQRGDEDEAAFLGNDRDLAAPPWQTAAQLIPRRQSAERAADDKDSHRFPPRCGAVLP
jgi:hypothetical protein